MSPSPPSRRRKSSKTSIKTKQLKRLQTQKTLAPEAAALMTMNSKQSLRRDRHLFLTIAATNAESVANRDGQPEIRKKK
jgi:hypothetical protein